MGSGREVVGKWSGREEGLDGVRRLSWGGGR
jgi:hypothetical protein